MNDILKKVAPINLVIGEFKINSSMQAAVTKNELQLR